MYGAYLAREGLFSEALRELNAALDLSPDDPSIALEMGVALALSGELERALDSFGRVVEMEPGDGWSRVILGLVELELGRLEEANLDLSEGARLRPEDVEAQLLASLTAQSVGWEDLAYEMLERARFVAESGDLPLLEAVEGLLGEGEEGAKTFLIEEALPTVLRERLMARP
jgi:tetratricopeptide (TPR) repeat protein